MGRIQNTGRYLVASGKLIWYNLPKIALYTVAIYALFFVSGQIAHAIDYRRIENTPATEFLNYTSFTVQNAREGEDVTFTLCRTHKENYSVNGTRTVYVIPEGKTEAQKVFIYNKDIKGVVDTGNCQPYYIRNEEYHFKPGKYLITLNLNFKVKYDIPKSVFTKSGIFTIYPQPSGDDDLQARLNVLQQQLSDQQTLLNQLIGSGAIQTPTRTSNGSSDNQTVSPSTRQPDNSDGGGQGSTNNDPNKAAQQQYREVCDPVVNLLGIRIGSINCRQEPV